MKLIRAILLSPFIIFPCSVTIEYPQLFAWADPKRRASKNTCRCCQDENLKWIWEGRKDLTECQTFPPLSRRFAA